MRHLRRRLQRHPENVTQAHGRRVETELAEKKRAFDGITKVAVASLVRAI